MTADPDHERDATRHSPVRTDRGPEPEDPDPDTSSPRLQEVDGHEGFPGPLVDTDRNMPGDQPVDARGPDKSELEGKR